MFRKNSNHNQQSIMESTRWMDPRIRAKLEESWAPIFYRDVFCQIDEAPFAVLYGKTGNPNFPVNILLSLEYIKHIRQCNDEELLDAFYFDYQVNYALGIRTLGEMNLAKRTLYYFRAKVYEYCVENPDKESVLFEPFLNLLDHFSKEANISLDEQRTDTTMFMSNIKKGGRISLAYDVLVSAAKAIPEEHLTEALAGALKPEFRTHILYRAKAEDADSRLGILLNLCQEALKILETMPDWLVAETVRITKRFLTEQSVPEPETGKLAPRPHKDIPSGSLQSAFDEDATYRKKGNIGQSGYVMEISETCGRGNPFQLITDCAVRPNNANDADILAERMETIQKNTGCKDMYVDGAFHSEDLSKAAEEAGITIHLTNMSGTEPTKKLAATAFDIDGDTNAILRCPAGHVPTRTGVTKGQTTAHFKHEDCAGCEFLEKCHSKKQVKDRVVRIDLKAVNASRERDAMKANQKENTSMRAGIEGSNSAMKRKGLKKLAVRGMPKCNVVGVLKATVQNIKRFIKWMRGGYKQTPAVVPMMA